MILVKAAALYSTLTLSLITFGVGLYLNRDQALYWGDPIGSAVDPEMMAQCRAKIASGESETEWCVWFEGMLVPPGQRGVPDRCVHGNPATGKIDRVWRPNADLSCERKS